MITPGALPCSVAAVVRMRHLGGQHAQGSVSSSQPQREAAAPNTGRSKRGGDDRSGQSGAELTSFGKVGKRPGQTQTSRLCSDAVSTCC